MEDGQKNDLISKIAYLGENFAPDQAWYVRTMNKVFELGGDFISQDLINKFIFRLTDIDEEIIKIYVKILKKSQNIPDGMYQIIAWICGEYGSKLSDTTKVAKIMNILVQKA